MRGTLPLFLVAAVAAACSSGGDSDPGPTTGISVGGTYQTAVTLVSNDCPGQTVEQHSTVVNHVPGGEALSLVHAGSTYSGTLAADGAFSTTPVTQVFDGISYVISISGAVHRNDHRRPGPGPGGPSAPVLLHRPVGRAQEW